MNWKKMTVKLKPAMVLFLVALLMQACSWFKDKPAEYLNSDVGAPLEIPTGLDKPRQVASITIGGGILRSPTDDELNPLPPRAAVTAGGGDANAYLAWSATGAYLAVKDSPESVARRLRFAIQRSGMNLVERSDDGAHKFEYQHLRTAPEKGFFEKMLFWRNDLGPDYSGTYLVRIQADGDETRVYLMFATGSPANSNAAEHVLGIFMERLG